MIFRNGVKSCDLKIHIPPEFEKTEKLRNTLGRKLNHSFKPNADFVELDSAR
jgi:hypothetical protein